MNSSLVLIVVFCACDDVIRTKQRGNGWLLLARAWKILKRSKNLVACYSYWPMSSSKRSVYSNRAVTTLIQVVNYLVEQAWFIFARLYSTITISRFLKFKGNAHRPPK